jgi:hypothetical protein
VARVYRGRVGVSIEAVQQLHESAQFPTEVKEVLAMFGPKTYGNDLVPSRLTVGFRAAAAANPITVV